MTRQLRLVSAADPMAVMQALRGALDRSGPAVLPVAATNAAAAAGSRPSNVIGAEEHEVPDTVPQSTALVIETSGSTGIPKRVMLSADAVLASVAASETALGGPGQWLLALPTHYVAGVQVLARSLAAGTTPEVLPPGPFDARAFAVAT